MQCPFCTCYRDTFNILLQINDLGSGVSKGEIARKVGIPPFSVGRYQSQSRHFSTAKLKEMLEQCVETEYLFKRGRIEGSNRCRIIVSTIYEAVILTDENTYDIILEVCSIYELL